MCAPSYATCSQRLTGCADGIDKLGFVQSFHDIRGEVAMTKVGFCVSFGDAQSVEFGDQARDQ